MITIKGDAMLTLKQARLNAKRMESITGKTFLVFEVPANAPCNEYPANVFNTGKYMTCKAEEKVAYEAGGARFIS